MRADERVSNQSADADESGLGDDPRSGTGPLFAGRYPVICVGWVSDPSPPVRTRVFEFGRRQVGADDRLDFCFQPSQNLAESCEGRGPDLCRRGGQPSRVNRSRRVFAPTLSQAIARAGGLKGWRQGQGVHHPPRTQRCAAALLGPTSGCDAGSGPGCRCPAFPSRRRVCAAGG